MQEIQKTTLHLHLSTGYGVLEKSEIIARAMAALNAALAAYDVELPESVTHDSASGGSAIRVHYKREVLTDES